MRASQSLSRPLLLRAFFFAALIAVWLMNTVSVQAQDPQRATVSGTKPVYSALGLRMHTLGSVLGVATVEGDGTVTNVQATTGDAFLQDQAEQAVRQWSFSRSTAKSDTTVEVQFAPDLHS